MVLASHYVLKDILNLLEREKHERLKELCMIYLGRYAEGKELIEVFDSILKHLDSTERSNAEDLTKRLTNLISARRMEVPEESKIYF